MDLSSCTCMYESWCSRKRSPTLLFSSVARAFGLDGISTGHKSASRHKGGFDLKTITVSTVSACSSDAMAHQFVLQLMMPHTCFL